MEPFKNLFNADLVRGMARHFRRHHKGFDDKAFVRFTLKGFDDLELKQRSSRIVEGMSKCLPDDFEAAAEILKSALHVSPPDDLYGAKVEDEGIMGWAIMPMGEYARLNEQDHFDLSRDMTIRFTSESTIRYFFLADHARTLKAIKP